MFRGEGYRAFCARHGMSVDASRFEAAVAQASAILNEARDDIYDAALFHRYTAAIIAGMGGSGTAVQTCAEEIYDEWAACQHFELYDDVPDTLRHRARGDPDRAHLEHSPLPRLVPDPLRARGAHQRRGVVVRSRLHEAASEHLRRCVAADRRAGRRRGDGRRQSRARHRRRPQVGMRGVLVRRSADIGPGAANQDTTDPAVPVIRSLAELPELL